MRIWDLKIGRLYTYKTALYNEEIVIKILNIDYKSEDINTVIILSGCKRGYKQSEKLTIFSTGICDIEEL